MNFKISLNSASIFLHLQQELSISYFCVSLPRSLLPGRSLSIFISKVSGEVTALLCAAPMFCADVAAPRTLHFLYYFVNSLERWRQHDVCPQHPMWYIFEAYLMRSIVLSTILVGSQFILSNPGV